MMRSKLLRKVAAAAAGLLMTAGLLLPAVSTQVKAADDEIDMNLALYIYSFGVAGTTENGEAVHVTGEGQYTVEFDCSKDLSDTAKDAGATAIAQIGSIYITDKDIMDGLASESPVSSCDIVYDSIVVDGKELTIVNTEPKSALKSGIIFDTNDPINAWDGSVVSDDDIIWNKTDYNITFAGLEDAQKISVTFTLSNITAKEVEKTEPTQEETEAETDAPDETEAATDSATVAAETTAAAQDDAGETGTISTGAIVGIVAAVIVIIIIIIVVASSKKKKK